MFWKVPYRAGQKCSSLSRRVENWRSKLTLLCLFDGSFPSIQPVSTVYSFQGYGK